MPVDVLQLDALDLVVCDSLQSSTEILDITIDNASSALSKPMTSIAPANAAAIVEAPTASVFTAALDQTQFNAEMSGMTPAYEPVVAFSPRGPAVSDRPVDTPESEPAIMPMYARTTQLNGLIVHKNRRPISVQILLDDGATSCFIHSRIVQQFNLPTQPISHPLHANSIHGRSEVNLTCEVKIRLEKYTETLHMYVLNHMNQYDIILGRNWCEHVQAVHDYSRHCVQIKHHEHTLNLKYAREAVRRDRQNYLMSINQIQTVLSRTHRIKHPEWAGAEAYVATVLMQNTSVHNKSNETFSKLVSDTLQSEYSDLFGEMTELPPHRVNVDHTVPLIDGTQPVNRPPHRLSAEQNDELKRQIDELLKLGFIRPSQSPFASPIIFVKKKDGTMRMCIDYRALNNITIKNRYPLPHTDDLMQRLVHAKYLTKLDLRSGYHQIRMADSDIHKTAFICRYGSFEYLVMPFGLCNAPATFMSMMHQVLNQYIDKCVIVFLDDILIYSETQEQHLRDVRKIFDELRQAKLYVKLSKCEFGLTETEFLGHIVGHGGIRMSPSKVAVIHQWPKPESITDVRSFLGMCNYYRKFVRNYSLIAKPLFDMLRGEATFNWSSSAQHAFDTLKQCMSTEPVLVLPDPLKQWFIFTDASGYGIGGVLCQLYDTSYRPIMFVSHKLTETELNWPTHDKEMYAIIYTLKQCRPYVEGKRVTVITDHNSLIYMHSQPKLSARQARWNEYLALFDVHILYKPGRTNVVADALSRKPDLRPTDYDLSQQPTGQDWNVTFDNLNEQESLQPSTLDDNTELSMIECAQNALITHDDIELTLFTVSSSVKVGAEFLERVRIAYQDDETCRALLQQNDTTEFTVRDGMIYKNHRLCIPRITAIINTVLHEYHDSPMACHRGVDKTHDMIIQHYYWQHMYDDIKQYVQSCMVCQQNKASNQSTPGLLLQRPPPNDIFEEITMDFIVQLPSTTQHHNGILVIVDRLSKWCELIPIKSERDSDTPAAVETAQLVLKHWVLRYGTPNLIITDRDTQFMSEFWTQLWSSQGTQLAMSTAYHPQTDGQTERVNRTLEEALRCYVDDDIENWDKYLPYVQHMLNTSTHSTIGMSPYTRVYGRDPTVPADLVVTQHNEVNKIIQTRAEIERKALEHFTRAQERQKRYADKNRRPMSYEVGDSVWVQTKHINLPVNNTSKLKHKYMGPFKIIRKINENAYELKLPATSKVHPVFNVSRLRRFVPRLKPQINDDNEILQVPNIIDDTEEYEVSQIINHRMRGKKMEYLIRWAGWSEYFNTWEPIDNLTHAREAIQQYHAKLDITPSNHTKKRAPDVRRTPGRKISRNANVQRTIRTRSGR